MVTRTLNSTTVKVPTSVDEVELLHAVLEKMGGTTRDGQERMVRLAAQALKEETNLVIQAGTGTGKSLGYLVPAMLRASETDERIIISTATVALQRQIVEHDAPRVNAELDHPVPVAVLKGWNHYACKHKVMGTYPMQSALLEEPVGKTTDTGEQVLLARQWALDSRTGDRDDLSTPINEAAWRQISVTTSECVGKTCRFRDECFAANARAAAARAQIVVTNHAMLGIHCQSDNSLLGSFDAVIIDEAHDLVRMVRSQATVELAASTWTRRLQHLENQLALPVERLSDAITELERALNQCPDGLIIQRDETLTVPMRVVDDRLRELISDIGKRLSNPENKQLALGMIADLSAFMEAWQEDPQRTITWISTSESGIASLRCAPLDVAMLLARALFDEHPAILTSATLQVGGSFAPFNFQVGLFAVKRSTDTADVGTPFNLSSQGIIYVAEHLPAPVRSGVSEEQLDELLDLVRASQGGALALFSSRAAAIEGAQALRDELPFEVLCQGEHQLSYLIARFREDMDSCLVGTLSLWQGIDVRGLSCRLVTIDRIPFPVPSDPVVAARSRYAAQHGRNAFQEVSLNHAALLMSQAAGRLLRSVDDRGMVAILDSRVKHRPYGAFIMNSLPPMWRTSKRDVALAALERLAELRHQEFPSVAESD